MRNLIKKILREDDFDWIREVPPFVLSDCNWAIKVNNAKEWREAEEFLFYSGWSWFGNLEGEHSDYARRFKYFVPDYCSEMFFDGVTIRYMLKYLPEHIIYEWSEIKGLVNESLNESDDLDWIRDVSGKRLKPWELMNQLTEIFPEIEMEMTEDQVTTGGYTFEGGLEITTHKEINPTNEEWFNRISGVMVKLSDNEELPYLIGDWYDNYYTGHLNDSDADWVMYGDLNDVIKYIKQYVGPNGEPHIYYGEEQEEDW